jgi:hypothetical protein
MYAAELDENNFVMRVIVGNAEWAIENLGGSWVDSEDKVGPGWIYEDGDINPPVYEEVEFPEGLEGGEEEDIS